MARRTHSSIDTLPAELREAITRMIVDAEWPNDFPWEKSDIDPEQYRKTKPRYEDIALFCVFKGNPVSRSAIGRHGKKLQIFELRRNAAEQATLALKDINAENAPRIQKAAAEMMGAQLLDMAVRENLTPKELSLLCRALKENATTSMDVEKYRQQQLKTKTEAAAKNVKAKLEGVGVDRKAIQEVMDEILILGKTQ